MITFPTYELEDKAKYMGYKFIVGVDEAGRGPGAGPVVAAAVHIPDESMPKLVGRVNDSKKVSPKRREQMYELVRSCCNYGVQEVSAKVIDEINILEATKMAMKSSVEQLEYFDYILIDGTVDLTKHVLFPQQQVIKGDAKSISIAAASIIAKVTRDRIMDDLHEMHPIYGWDTNRGYLTRKHIDAIKTYGITEYHRASFKRVGR
jgi:ribonuclease HII